MCLMSYPGLKTEEEGKIRTVLNQSVVCPCITRDKRTLKSYTTQLCIYSMDLCIILGFFYNIFYRGYKVG